MVLPRSADSRARLRAPVAELVAEASDGDVAVITVVGEGGPMEESIVEVSLSALALPRPLPLPVLALVSAIDSVSHGETATTFSWWGLAPTVRRFVLTDRGGGMVL